MAQLYLMESKSGDRSAGGVLFKFPSGRARVASWTSDVPVADCKAMGQQLATRVLDSLLTEPNGAGLDDADRTNWTSVVAACAALVRQWNARVGPPGVPH